MKPTTIIEILKPAWVFYFHRPVGFWLAFPLSLHCTPRNHPLVGPVDTGLNKLHNVLQNKMMGGLYRVKGNLLQPFQNKSSGTGNGVHPLSELKRWDRSFWVLRVSCHLTQGFLYFWPRTQPHLFWCRISNTSSLPCRKMQIIVPVFKRLHLQTY